jgi:hypothetical protein
VLVHILFCSYFQKKNFRYTYIEHFKHHNKEDQKSQSLLHSIDSFHYISTSSVRQKRKKDKKDVFSKCEYLSRQIIRREKKTPTNKSRVCADKKRSITMIWKQKEKTGPKNMIIQMKEGEKKADS